MLIFANLFALGIVLGLFITIQVIKQSTQQPKPIPIKSVDVQGDCIHYWCV